MDEKKKINLSIYSSLMTGQLYLLRKTVWNDQWLHNSKKKTFNAKHYFAFSALNLSHSVTARAVLNTKFSKLHEVIILFTRDFIVKAYIV